MKKPLLTPIFVLLALYSFAQDKIEGVGKFKVKKTTTSIMKDIATELGTKIQIVTNYDQYFDLTSPSSLLKKQRVLEFKPDTIDKANYYNTTLATLCPEYQVFLITSYDIAGINLKNIRLTYFRDTLAAFHCDYSTQIKEALTLKYGASKDTATTKDVLCTFTYTGNQVTYKEVTSYNRWNNDDISATLYLHRYYDDKCKEKFLSYFDVSVAKHILTKSSCDEEMRKNAAEQMKKVKKDKYSDF